MIKNSKHVTVIQGISSNVCSPSSIAHAVNYNRQLTVYLCPHALNTATGHSLKSLLIPFSYLIHIQF